MPTTDRTNQILAIIPGDEACIMSGLNRATSEMILGLSARDRGTFWYQGHGKLGKQKEETRKSKVNNQELELKNMFETWKIIKSKVLKLDYEATSGIQSISLHKIPGALLHVLSQPSPMRLLVNQAIH